MDMITEEHLFGDHSALQKTALNSQPTPRVLPSLEGLEHARSSLVSSLPLKGLGLPEIKHHILDDIVPGLNLASISPNYYGFVTGGVTPAALFADNVVSAYDQNVQIHIREHSVATDVEDRALKLLLDLFRFEAKDWPHATITTGATASNVLGLACGREFVLRTAAERNGSHGRSVGEYGMVEVLRAAGLNGLQVLSTSPHSSLGKAAGILGIGRANVKTVSTAENPLKFDFERLEKELALPGMASIVAVSCGEVNTGRFATSNLEEFRRLREICDKYNAWLHVDGAFGLFTRVLSDDQELNTIRRGSDGLEFADSITGDGHKLLNVPYDCGFFFSRHANDAREALRNPSAAYLSPSSTSVGSVVSPLNAGFENSRRFRALPVYATLLAYGREGYQAMLKRQIQLARNIGGWLFDHPEYTTHPADSSRGELIDNIFMIVLFSARDDSINANLVQKINDTSDMFVSSTVWNGRPACRLAVSTYKVDVERDTARVVKILEGVVSQATI